MLDEQPEVAAALVRCFARALETVHREPDRVLPVVARLLGEDTETARATYELALPCFTADGRAEHAELQRWIDDLEAELPGDRHVDALELYDFSLLP
jgi:ABC-type nitrate/sulfonate/bicarbonate transport system substrate-binding protein